MVSVSQCRHSKDFFFFKYIHFLYITRHFLLYIYVTFLVYMCMQILFDTYSTCESYHVVAVTDVIFCIVSDTRVYMYVQRRFYFFSICFLISFFFLIYLNLQRRIIENNFMTRVRPEMIQVFPHLWVADLNRHKIKFSLKKKIMKGNVRHPPPLHCRSTSGIVTK